MGAKLWEKRGDDPSGAEAAEIRSHVGSTQLVWQGRMRIAVAVTLKVTEGVYSRLRLTGKCLQPEAAHQILDPPGPSSPSLLALRFAWAHSLHKQSGLKCGVNEVAAVPKALSSRALLLPAAYLCFPSSLEKSTPKERHLIDYYSPVIMGLITLIFFSPFRCQDGPFANNEVICDFDNLFWSKNRDSFSPHKVSPTLLTTLD